MFLSSCMLFWVGEVPIVAGDLILFERLEHCAMSDPGGIVAMHFLDSEVIHAVAQPSQIHSELVVVVDALCQSSNSCLV